MKMSEASVDAFKKDLMQLCRQYGLVIVAEYNYEIYVCNLARASVSEVDAIRDMEYRERDETD